METERLLLRRYRDEDFPFLKQLLADPEVMQFIGDGKTRNRERALEFLYWIYRGYKEDPELGLRVLVRKRDGKALGHAGLVRQFVDGKEEGELGYWLDRKQWGRGYATEAAGALLAYGFSLGYERIVSLIQPENTGSRKVAERLGMVFEKETDFSGRPTCVYAIGKGGFHGISSARNETAPPCGADTKARRPGV